MKDSLSRKCVKEGVSEKNMNKLVIQIFGRESDVPAEAGILASKDEEEFALRQSEILEQDFVQDNASVLIYLDTNFMELVKQKMWMPMQKHSFHQEEHYFNNAVESLNIP